MGGKHGTPMERIERKLNKDSDSGCWVFTGFLSRGYGRIQITTNRGALVHRVVYESLVGPIPDGLVIDHLCRNRACCNPEHLRVVTQQVNIVAGEGLPAQNAAKEMCPAGHNYDYTYRDGRRGCKTCIKDSGALRYQQNKERIKARSMERYYRLRAAATG
jgi:hypothetical protein